MLDSADAVVVMAEMLSNADFALTAAGPDNEILANDAELPDAEHGFLAGVDAEAMLTDADCVLTGAEVREMLAHDAQMGHRSETSWDCCLQGVLSAEGETEQEWCAEVLSFLGVCPGGGAN